MFPTIEVKWFFRGAVPSGIWEWICLHGHDWEKQPPRIDNYLQITEGDSLGVKLREGRIEIKQLLWQTICRANFSTLLERIEIESLNHEL